MQIPHDQIHRYQHPERVSDSPPPPPGRHAPLDILDEEHLQTLRRAILNVLSTDVAELTYAQLLDGLPTRRSLSESYLPMLDHPVHKLGHDKLCGGFLDEARDLRSNVDFSKFGFEAELLDAFNTSTPGSDHFKLRLVELVVATCHQVGAYLFEMDSGNHGRRLHDDWAIKANSKSREERKHVAYNDIPACAFFHAAFLDHERYPRGKADVAGYWAEGKIFGGVVVFDRGDTDRECKSMWIQGALIHGPHTLYPPTPGQFGALVNFLVSEPTANAPCPLPIHATKDNIPRWDPSEAFTYFHIFRDRHERRKVEAREGPHRLRQDGAHWPEVGDEFFLMNQQVARARGRLVDEEAVAAAEKRLEEVTPTSPCWRHPRPWRKPW